MTPNEQIVANFYKAFQQKDVKTMQDSYADEAVFNDSVFRDLSAPQVKAMWQMLLSRGGDIKVEFRDIREEGDKVLAKWIARYIFTATGKKVVNEVNATFEIVDGKIVKHTDNFNFYKWAKQAFGGGGLLLGWTNFFMDKVRYTAQKKLDVFMEKTNRQ